MNEDTGIKILAIPGAMLLLIGIGYAYRLAVGGCHKPTNDNRIYNIDLAIVASGILLASGTAIAGYQTGIASSSVKLKGKSEPVDN